MEHRIHTWLQGYFHVFVLSETWDFFSREETEPQGRKLSDFTPDCILGIHFWQVFIHVLFAVSSVSTMLGVGRFPLPSSPRIHASNPCTLLTSTKTVKSAFSIQHN